MRDRRSHSRIIPPIVAAMLLLGLAAAQAAEPEVARVKTDRALVHHAAEGYPTSELAAGSLVAVLQTKGDWVAIKPPPGSFCWIAASQLDVSSDEGGLARIAGEDVKVYVGTIFEQDRLAWQVKLKQGEAVEIRGKRQIATDEGETTWYKISPPSNEVRWMLSADLDRGEPVELADAKPKPAPSAGDPAGERYNPVKAAAFHEPAAGDAARPSGTFRSAIPLEPIRGSEPIVAPSMIARRDAPVASPPAGGWRVARSRPLSDFRGDSRPGAPAVSASPYSAPPPPLTSQPAGNEFADRLEWLELELARMATKEPREWNFALVRQEGAKLLEGATTSVERGRARLLLEKIDQFDEVRSRYEKLAAQQATGVAAGPAPPAAPTTPAAPAPGLLDTLLGGAASGPATSPAALAAAGDYAGKGYLMPIVSARKNVPRFALTDDRGEILQFVTPTPGLNLNQYLRRPVGLSGRTGFLPELGKPHITAERVIDLDRQLLR